jgi:hypothetical protein
MPMTPVLAQRIASDIGCSLPTTLIVDRVFAQASIRLHPQPIPPTDTMTSVSVFLQHNDSVHAQLRSLGTAVAPGSLLAGHKKDVVLSNLITHGLKPGRPFPVVIYGWHRPDGTVIQPPYNGHGETYADYSHGVRLVRDTLLIDGRPESLRLLLVDPERSALVSDEGAISQPYYRTHDNQP